MTVHLCVFLLLYLPGLALVEPYLREWLRPLPEPIPSRRRRRTERSRG
jgi:hypothetical protein